MKKLLRRPVRLDRAVRARVYDLEILRRTARLCRWPAKYLRGRSGAAR